MKDTELIELSTYIITEFYMHNLEPYFEYIDDDMLWVGPYDSLIYRGKDAMIANAQNEPRDAHFVVNTISSEYIKTSVNTAEVLLLYKVYSSFGQGDMSVHDQRIQFSWTTKKIADKNGNRHQVPRISMINIANLLPFEGEESENPMAALNIAPPQILLSKTETGRRIEITGLDKGTYFLLPATIMYVESCDGGQHSILHILDRDITCINKLSELVDKYPDVFIRVHESYLVNPGYVCAIKRFSVSLVQGPTLPIPERRYTAIKKQLQDFFTPPII